jgi:hypothetical protein
MKRCKIRIEHSTHPPFKLQLRPNTRVSFVLASLNLCEDYVLIPSDDPTKTFAPEENLYDLISPDDKLVAKLSQEAIEKYLHTFLP